MLKPKLPPTKYLSNSSFQNAPTAYTENLGSNQPIYT